MRPLARSSPSPARLWTRFFGYTGRFFDDDTGLQWNTNRWYDPGVGRWISEDPIGFAAGDPNLYRYVGNSVADSVDPDGLAKNRLPDPDKGKWIHGTPGNGVFVYTAFPDRPLVYKDDSPVFGPNDLYIAPDGKAREVTIKMDVRSSVSRVTRSTEDMNRADAEMRKIYGDDWKIPRGYTWNHKKLMRGYKCSMQLVNTEAHTFAPHSGPRSKVDASLGLPFRSPNPRKSRGGYVVLPRVSFPSPGGLRIPKLNGAVRGAAPIAGPIALDLGIGYADDLTDGAVANFLDNTAGSDPVDMCVNIGRLFGPDWRRHWRYIFDQESAYGGGGHYNTELMERFRHEQAMDAQDEAIQRYEDLVD